MSGINKVANSNQQVELAPKAQPIPKKSLVANADFPKDTVEISTKAKEDKWSLVKEHLPEIVGETTISAIGGALFSGIIGAGFFGIPAIPCAIIGGVVAGGSVLISEIEKHKNGKCDE